MNEFLIDDSDDSEEPDIVAVPFECDSPPLVSLACFN